MCAIFGSYNKSMFEILHGANLDRGSWGGSLTSIRAIKNISPNSAEYDDIKSNGGVEIERWSGSNNKIARTLKGNKSNQFLGHLQAPTGSERKWDERFTHPFVVGSWVIAHNGVITNQSELIKEYNNSKKVAVDSQLIPIITNSIGSSSGNIKHIDILQKALSKLEGTFSVWVYNKKNKKVYIARQGSTLFADDNGNFSSVNSKNEWEEVKEGKIFEVSKKGPILVGQFNNNSPFFRLV